MALLTLDEAKAALNLVDVDPARDDLLLDFITGVTSVVEAEVGWVDQRTEVLKIRQGDWPRRNNCEWSYEFALPGRNVISLTSGVDDRSGLSIDVTGMYVSDGGVLRYVSGAALPLQPWTLTLVVGMTTVPPAIKRGAAEVLIEAWATQRGPGPAGDARSFLIPRRAAAWFAGYETGPGFA